MSLVAKTERIELRVSAPQKEAIARAAEAQGATMSDFISRAATSAAEAALVDRTRFLLPPDKWAEFVEALERPPERNERLAAFLTRKSILE
ncbi:MAG: DUF1778 domain-containing protein [Vitreimonas sp.]